MRSAKSMVDRINASVKLAREIRKRYPEKSWDEQRKLKWRFWKRFCEDKL